MRPLAVVLAHVGALVLGVGVAVCSLVVHRSLLGGIAVGALLCYAVSLAVIWALSELAWPRRLASSFALGWLLLLGLVLFGDYDSGFLLAGDARGYALLGCALLTLVLGVAGRVPGVGTRPDPS